MSAFYLLKYRLKNNDIILKRKIKIISFILILTVLIPVYLLTTPFENLRNILKNKEVETLSLKTIAKSSNNNDSNITTGNIILPINGTITSNYGYRQDPITGSYSKHTGIDISGIHHDYVRVIDDGIVNFVGSQNGYGNCIEIKHNNYYSFYAHLSKINVNQNTYVKKGDIIGIEGGDPSSDPNPGYSTGHHLHFEIRYNSGYGNDINPSNYIFKKLN